MSAIPSPPGGVRESSIGELTALRAYEWMFRIRVFEERCQSLSDAGVFAGSIHLCAGQEAIPGAAALAPDGTSPPSDTNATAEFRRHLAQVMVRRAVEASMGS